MNLSRAGWLAINTGGTRFPNVEKGEKKGPEYGVVNDITACRVGQEHRCASRVPSSTPASEGTTQTVLLEDFEYHVETSKCDPSATRLRAVAEFQADVSCVFPYLNSRFQDCEYNPETRVVRLTSGGRVYAIHPSMIVTGVQDVSEAQPVFAHVRDVINNTWERRSEITPREEPRVRAPALEVYKLLPRTNCGVCGEKTCMAFAVKLASGATELEECPALEVPARARLQDALS